MAKKDELNLNKKNKEVKLSRHGFTPFQKLLMLFGGAIILASLILIVCGLIGDYVFIPNNVFENANDALTSAFGFGLTLTWLGVFLLIIGAIVIAITLMLSSNTEEREAEKELRKSERLSALKQARKEMVVDVNVTTAATRATEPSSLPAKEEVKVVEEPTPKPVDKEEVKVVDEPTPKPVKEEPKVVVPPPKIEVNLYDEFVKDIKSHQDKDRSEFSDTLLNTNKEVFGVKSKDIKFLARKYKDIDFTNFDLNSIYEVTLLYFIISIKRIKETKDKLRFYTNNAHLIDTWAIPDSVATILKQASFEDALNLISYENEYVVRLGYVLMLHYTKDRAYTQKTLNSFKNDSRYYVQMAEGWVLSTLFVYDFDVAYDWAQNNPQLNEIILVGIQKGIDSTRTTLIQKSKLKELREKIRSNK